MGARKCRAVFVDSFSGAMAELPPGKRTVEDGLRALLADPRVSTFERGAPWLERLIDDLKARDLIIEDHAEPYPWHRFNLTAAGKRMVGQHGR